MGVGKVYPTYPMIDPVSRPVYLLVAGCFAASLLMMVAFGFSIDADVLPIFITWPVVMIGGLLARRIGFFRTATILQSLALMYGQGLCLMLVIYGMAAMGWPFVDAYLARADEAVGLDWPGYAQAMLPYVKPLTIGYKSFAWQPLILVLVLTIAGQERRLWTLIAAAISALAITSALFLFFPAEGVYNHYGYSLADTVKVGSYSFDRVIDYLRGGGRVINKDVLTGLVSFPSYHTAAALLNIWAAWSVKWLRWPMLALNGVVLISVPVIGAHYFVDMAGGAVVAIIAIWCANALIRSRPEAGTTI